MHQLPLDSKKGEEKKICTNDTTCMGRSWAVEPACQQRCAAGAHRHICCSSAIDIHSPNCFAPVWLDFDPPTEHDRREKKITGKIEENNRQDGNWSEKTPKTPFFCSLLSCLLGASELSIVLIILLLLMLRHTQMRCPLGSCSFDKIVERHRLHNDPISANLQLAGHRCLLCLIVYAYARRHPVVVQYTRSALSVYNKTVGQTYWSS